MKCNKNISNIQGIYEFCHITHFLFKQNASPIILLTRCIMLNLKYLHRLSHRRPNSVIFLSTFRTGSAYIGTFDLLRHQSSYIQEFLVPFDSVCNKIQLRTP
jgi:hypothetical protein